MTTALLILLVLMELARLALQYRQGKVYADERQKTYCAASKVENSVKVVPRDASAIRECMEQMSADKWELAETQLTRNGNTMLFFTRKEIKNYTEE